MIIRKSNIDFHYYTVCAAEPGPHLLITSGIHGDEFEPMIAAVNLINIAEKILRKGSVTILPVANRSAYTYGKRCGEDQLDLARTFPGKLNGTQTEKLAKSLSQLIKKSDYLIDLHNGGALFDIMPLAGYMLHADAKILKQQQQMALSFNLPVIWGTDAKPQGRTLSVARDHNIPAIYVECRGGLRINKSNFKLYENGCLNVMHALGMTNSEQKKKKIENCWLEDYRPGQGHLQVKLPALDDGIFIPEMKIGKKVNIGSLLGYIVNPLTRKRTNVISSEEGLLFMLRISSRVNVGDSLGGILPVSNGNKKIIHAK